MYAGGNKHRGFHTGGQITFAIAITLSKESVAKSFSLCVRFGDSNYCDYNHHCKHDFSPNVKTFPEPTNVINQDKLNSHHMRFAVHEFGLNNSNNVARTLNTKLDIH